MANILPKTTFKNWSQDPKTAMLILMAGLLLLFAYAWRHSKNESHDDCEQEKKEWRDLYVVEKRLNDSFKMQLIMKDQTTNQVTALVDSILKAKTNDRVNNILKENK